jgi:hypothetical protein
VCGFEVYDVVFGDRLELDHVRDVCIAPVLYSYTRTCCECGRASGWIAEANRRVRMNEEL